MRLFLAICFCVMTLPLGAVPSLTDLDSWQIPDEPEPVKKEAPKPAPKKVVDVGPEIVIEMEANGTVQGPARQQVSHEIAVLNRSAKQLATTLAGKSRFYVVFNANITPVSDTQITALDGTQYALLFFGEEGKNYRQFLFKYWADQPLVAVAENTTDRLNIFQNYGVNLGLTETDLTAAYPQAQVKVIEDAADHTPYNTYKFSDTFFVSFKEGQPVAKFSSEEDFTAYTDKLQNITPSQEETEITFKPIKRDLYTPPVTVTPRPKFTDLVKGGTFQERAYREQQNRYRNSWDGDVEAPNQAGSYSNRQNNSRR